MKEKGITKYKLIYHYGISSNTLRRISHNEVINTSTINQFCLILGCNISDIIKFEATDEEVKQINLQKEKTMEKFSRNSRSSI